MSGGTILSNSPRSSSFLTSLEFVHFSLFILFGFQTVTAKTIESIVQLVSIADKQISYSNSNSYPPPIYTNAFSPKMYRFFHSNGSK